MQEFGVDSREKSCNHNNRKFLLKAQDRLFGRAVRKVRELLRSG
jgi:hypothetical protein